MGLSSYQISEILHLRSMVTAETERLKLMRSAPPNTYPRMEIRKVELGLDFNRSRLRVMEEVARKYDANQPRVPAGNPDGGQWTDGGRFGSFRSSPSVDPIKTDATSAQRRSNNDRVKPASYSGRGQHSNLEFNESQKAELRSKIGSGKGAYVEAYKYLHQQVQNRLQNPGLSIMDRKEFEAQEFWLRKAGEINADDPNSQASFFIRNVTRNGLRFDGMPFDPVKIQANSNLIGEHVMGSVLQDGKLPSMQEIIAKDALSATDQERGHQTIGGWGGAFNYWDIPLSNEIGDTVGSRISKYPAEYEKFISVNAKALADTVRKFRLDRYPENSAQAIIQGLNAQVPAKIKSDILDRAIDGINGERGGFAGDPNNIDGYRPRFDENDNVIGWFSRDKRLKEIDVTDGSKIERLNMRYHIRQSKGEFHPWQNAD